MPRVFEIPLSPHPQRFAIPLSGTTYVLAFQFRALGEWGTTVGTWHLDILDENGFALACGIPIVTGVNLLAPFDYLNFTGELWAVTEGSDAPPDYYGFGIDSHVYYVTLTRDERDARSAALAATPIRYARVDPDARRRSPGANPYIDAG